MDPSLADLEAELDDTRRVLDALPDASWGWKPRPQAFTLGELANHTVQLLHWTRTVLEADAFDVAAAVPEDLARVGTKELAAPWSLTQGGTVLFTKPRSLALRRDCVSRLVHHRAQLALCLRLLGRRPPPLYSPA